MIENRVLTMDDYAAMLRRRLKIILIPTLLAPLVGFLISYAFPAKYTSQALVLVQQQQVPQGYVAPVVTEDLSQRVGTLQQKAMGSDRLRPLIQKLTQQGILRSGNIEDEIDQIRSGVAIEPLEMVMVPNPAAKPVGPHGVLSGTGPKAPQVPGFNLDYTAGNPREAQAICAGVTDIMLQENLRDR
ncbi:MAG TPA: Wzz/FepE/Etk N-terminal domain-containing protein, partial [Candidatus Angelobacter sp.]|nr:Wzz/FepE/Etk N-terminal domain-containing protein [Candidatus Angelobacter sp.]